MKRHPIKSDQRYTVTLEWCGDAKPRYIARFCGEWIAKAASYPAAVLLATGHRAQRNGAIVFTNQPA